ncbi:MAG: pyridoxamine 5'-phosphate oxidase family protein [Bryobacteraceae bacterium]
MTTENGASRQDAIKKLRELIKDLRVGMLTTVTEEDGTLRSRPMATQEAEFDGDLWFLTSIDSAKSHEIDKDHRVNVSYADAGANRFVSVSGTARVFRDEKKIKSLWSPLYKAWFPKGVSDPSIALLRVQVDDAEYWDGPSSTFVQIVGFVKALATGTQYEGANHEKVAL